MAGDGTNPQGGQPRKRGRAARGGGGRAAQRKSVTPDAEAKAPAGGTAIEGGSAKAQAAADSGRKARGHRPGEAGVPSSRSVKITIPSDFTAGREVQRRVLENIAASGYGARSAFAIKLALEEAIINAIKHGNRLDPAKRVHVEVNVTVRQTEIIVEDEGPGFERKRVPDPTLEENLVKCSGRGILLIEAYMNEVEWSRGGRRVRMVRTNDG